MSVAHLRHNLTQAEISVEVPPTGLSSAYLRSGWVEFTPEPEKPKAAPKKQPAEPVNPSSASKPDTKIKE